MLRKIIFRNVTHIVNIHAKGWKKNILISKQIFKISYYYFPVLLFVGAYKVSVGSVVEQLDENIILHSTAYHTSVLWEIMNIFILLLNKNVLLMLTILIKIIIIFIKICLLVDHATLVWLKDVKNVRERLHRLLGIFESEM